MESSMKYIHPKDSYKKIHFKYLKLIVFTN